MVWARRRAGRRISTATTAAGPSGDALLLEDSFYILLEDGSFLLLE